MKRLVILLLPFMLCFRAFGADYDTSGVPEYTLSLAKRMGLHEEILKKAEFQKISTDTFTDFYIRVAMKNIQLRNNHYYTVIKELDTAPYNVFEYYRQRTDTEPANADYWAFRAMAEEKISPGYAAIRSYGNAIELDTDGGHFGYLYYRRGKLHRYLGEPAKAVSDMEASLKEVSGNPLAHLELAHARFDLADYENSARDLSVFFTHERQSELSRRESMSFLCEALSWHGSTVTGCANLSATRAAYIKANETAIASALKSVKGDAAAKALRLAASTDTVRLLAAERILDGAKPSPKISFLRGYVRYLLADQRVYSYSEAKAEFAACAKAAKTPVLKAWALERQADIYGKYGDLKTGIALLGDALVLQKSEPRFYLARAGAYMAAANPVAAAEDLSDFFRLADKKLTAVGSASRVCRQFTENGIAVPQCKTAKEFAEIPPWQDSFPAPPVDRLVAR